MSDIEAAKEDYKINFLNIKGVIGVCSGSSWEANTFNMQADLPAAEEEFVLKIYIDNSQVIDILPREFMGYKCEYTVCPDGYDHGCD